MEKYASSWWDTGILIAAAEDYGELIPRWVGQALGAVS